jgi:transposase, IS5 family
MRIGSWCRFGIAVETYLRLMYLKYRYGLGYETLVREVADSFSWRRFCRIALDARVPDSTTLIKLTNRLGPDLLEELNAELLKVAVERRVLRSRRLRIDATVVESDTRYPTDSGLCAHVVSRLTAATGAVQDAGLAPRCRVRDRRRSVAKRIRWISAALSRVGRSREAVDALTAEVATRAAQTAREARRVLRNAERALRGGARRGAAQVARLARELEAAEQILTQTAARLRGERSIPNRRISLVDADARPVPSGKRYRPHQFGYKARVADTAEGFLICEIPRVGNPPDDALLGGALDRAIDAGMRVQTVFADRGFSTPAARDELARRGITDIVMPSRGRAGPREQSRAWRRRYRFRNGIEGRISQAKRHGLRRTRLRGLAGAQTWVGGLTLAHNLRRMAALTA